MSKRQLQFDVGFLLQPAGFRLKQIVDPQQQLDRFVELGFVIQRLGMRQCIVDFIRRYGLRYCTNGKN